ncbi:aminotransferase class I/II-fold pyridoxal phosphate-dependent enzyme [Pantoea sp. S61]|uniref:pyridoxal phosphate-dependent aminotransferase n=1 Tax=Pantoea sp. S61 TaxID=2767442 RepID=UPI00190CC49B|nr:aminotransferase class I/II-fold pyridoxal phosphate-dependent enzyme [Pantoea sp. S61]MBK0123598.1 aminotransferase class I/II-fold pyridoxal phosphate-dependent enzyme [Pantoea sp. S61]
MFADRLQHLKTSGTTSARLAAEKAVASGKHLIDLTSGEVWCDTHPLIKTGAIKAIESNINKYTHPLGILQLRQTLAKVLSDDDNVPWSAEEIAVTSGAMQALFNTMMVLLNKGDEVILSLPYWSTYPAQISLAGGIPVFIDTRDTHYKLTIEDIKRSLTSKTKIILVNTPSNPTGVLLDSLFLKQLAQIAEDNDIWIIFDQVYKDFIYDKSSEIHFLNLAPKIRNRTVLINSLSKNLALTGWRLGFLAAPKSFVDQISIFQGNTTNNVNVITQYAALEYLQSLGSTVNNVTFSQLLHSRDVAANELKMLHNKLISFNLPSGGLFIYFNFKMIFMNNALRDKLISIDNLVELLITDIGVACVSGNAFGDEYGLRVSIGAPTVNVKLGISRLVSFFNCLH